MESFINFNNLLKNKPNPKCIIHHYNGNDGLNWHEEICQGDNNYTKKLNKLNF
jgi:hypothetical protein